MAMFFSILIVFFNLTLTDSLSSQQSCSWLISGEYPTIDFTSWTGGASIVVYDGMSSSAASLGSLSSYVLPKSFTATQQYLFVLLTADWDGDGVSFEATTWNGVLSPSPTTSPTPSPQPVTQCGNDLIVTGGQPIAVTFSAAEQCSFIVLPPDDMVAQVAYEVAPSPTQP